MSSPTTLRQRLLLDIAELQDKPYPNIKIHLQDDQLDKICLVLNVDGYGPMHLTILIPAQFPLSPPTVQMNSSVSHPNIFGSYICASILNTVEGYTPAYTLKGIAIQLLSFFGSEKIEQSGGTYSIKLDNYRDRQLRVKDDFKCTKCGFTPIDPTRPQRSSLADYMSNTDFDRMNDSDSSESTQPGQSNPSRSPRFRSRNARRREAKSLSLNGRSSGNDNGHVQNSDVNIPHTLVIDNALSTRSSALQKSNLPDEVLLMICERLDFEELMAFARSWSRIAHLIPKFDIIRTRELQCFLFKKGYLEIELGVGVNIEQKAITSEFDLLSLAAFNQHRVRRSVQGKDFRYWLPLPISYGHWRKVNQYLTTTLTDIGREAQVKGHVVQVIYSFMNDIVVKLNKAADTVNTQPIRHYYSQEEVKSSLTHASEKAIESYFHLFHILLCMATAQPSIITAADTLLKSFLAGNTSKSHVPNLGHLLIAALITNVPIDSTLLRAIIRETVTRNVVWMLKDHPELAFLEPEDTNSPYRLQETFRASKTSYRLLMFLNLFRRTAVGSPRTKSLIKLRDEAFARHGAPPLGSTAGLAQSIKQIHQIDNFPDFLAAMGVEKGGPVGFSNFLRRTVRDSEKMGYSRMPISKGEAYALRKSKEPSVAGGEGLGGYAIPDMSAPFRSFFPGRHGGRGGAGVGTRIGRGGRGRGGRGRGF